MKVIDLLSLISDYTNVLVMDTDGNELGYYDGRDSIPENLNEREIESVSASIYKLWGDIPCISITVL